MKINIGILGLFLMIMVSSNLLGQDNSKLAVVIGNIETNWSNKIQIGDSITSIDNDGMFQIKLVIQKPDFITLSYEYKDQELFISPDDTIIININGKDFYNSISVDESEQKLNNFLLNQKRLLIETKNYLKDNETRIYTSEASRFLSIIDSIEQIYINNFNEFLQKDNTKINSWFVTKNNAEIKYHFDRRKLWYPVKYRRYLGKDPQIKPEYFTNIAKDAFNNPNLLDSKIYLQFVSTYLNIQSAGKYKTTDYMMYPIKKAGTPRYDAIIDFKANQQITDYLLTEFLKSQIGFGVNRLGNLLERYNNDCKNESLKTEVHKLYTEELEKRKSPSEIKVFKKIDNVELEAHIFYPEGFRKSDKRPFYVFFHGGAWNEGNPSWGYDNCQNYASKGMVAISFEYRLIDLDGVTIPDCIEDAKSAIRWARQNANILGIDSAKIVAEGFSSGGHLAACTAIIENGNDKNYRYSCKPNALILKSTPYSVIGYAGMKNINGEPFSPLYQVKSNLVPTIMFHGTKDYIVSIKVFNEFIEKMKELGNDFVYHSFEGAGHFDLLNKENCRVESHMIEAFLISNGFIE